MRYIYFIPLQWMGGDGGEWRVGRLVSSFVHSLVGRLFGNISSVTLVSVQLK